MSRAFVSLGVRHHEHNERRVVRSAKVIGYAALLSSVLYFVSDLIEAAHGGFTVGQLWLTLVSEAAIPFVVVGIAMAQGHQSFGLVGDVSAVAYAYSYLYFTGTVLYALANVTKDYGTLTAELGPAMTLHGAVMVFAGLGFGYAVLRARLLPAWTAVALMAGVVLVAVSQNMPEGLQLIAAGVRDLGFAGMGVALLRPARRITLR
jgi:hypothetical protein